MQNSARHRAQFQLVDYSLDCFWLVHLVLWPMARSRSCQTALPPDDQIRWFDRAIYGNDTIYSDREKHRIDVRHSSCCLPRSNFEPKSLQETFKRHYTCRDASESMGSATWDYIYAFHCSPVCCFYSIRVFRPGCCATGNAIHYSV